MTADTVVIVPKREIDWLLKPLSDPEPKIGVAIVLDQGQAWLCGIGTHRLHMLHLGTKPKPRKGHYAKAVAGFDKDSKVLFKPVDTDALEQCVDDGHVRFELVTGEVTVHADLAEAAMDPPDAEPPSKPPPVQDDVNLRVAVWRAFKQWTFEMAPLEAGAAVNGTYLADACEMAKMYVQNGGLRMGSLRARRVGVMMVEGAMRVGHDQPEWRAVIALLTGKRPVKKGPGTDRGGVY